MRRFFEPCCGMRHFLLNSVYEIWEMMARASGRARKTVLALRLANVILNSLILTTLDL